MNINTLTECNTLRTERINNNSNKLLSQNRCYFHMWETLERNATPATDINNLWA